MKKAAILILMLLLCASISLSPIRTSKATGGNLWAVIVCATPDLSEESDFLYETLTTYYDFTDIYYLNVNTSKNGVDALMTKDNVRRALNTTLAQWSDSDDIVFIYFMSHGGGYNMLYAPDYWLLPNHLEGGAIDLNGDEGDEVRESSIIPAWDYNKDGVIDDTWLGVDERMILNYSSGDETLQYVELYLDDELAYDLSGIDYSRLIFVYVGCIGGENSTAHCFSGGYIDDLSAPNRIIMTPSNETSPAMRRFERVFDEQGYYNSTIYYDMSFWGYAFISALGVNKTEADRNKDGVVTMLEAFDFARVNDPMTVNWHFRPKEFYADITETPWMDDNGNGKPNFIGEGYELDNDGLLAYTTHLGINPVINGPDINDDGLVNIRDIGVIAVHFGESESDPNWWYRADVYMDGKINIKDIGVVAIYFERW